MRTIKIGLDKQEKNMKTYHYAICLDCGIKKLVNPNGLCDTCIFDRYEWKTYFDLSKPLKEILKE